MKQKILPAEDRIARNEEERPHRMSEDNANRKHGKTLGLTGQSMDDYIRHKRKNGKVYTWPCKLYIAVPLSTKNAFTKAARLAGMSQAEFGAVVVMHYLSEPSLIQAAVSKYQERSHELRQEFLENQKQQAEQPFDRTFGGVFNSSFPGEE